MIRMRTSTRPRRLRITPMMMPLPSTRTLRGITCFHSAGTKARKMIQFSNRANSHSQRINLRLKARSHQMMSRHRRRRRTETQPRSTAVNAMNILVTLIGMWLCPALAVADPVGAPVCIDTYRIDHTRTPDNRTIIFYMKGGIVYQSTLPAECPMLRFNGFGYVATPPAQICGNLQSIRVLRTGSVCLLGPLVPITPSSNKPG